MSDEALEALLDYPDQQAAERHASLEALFPDFEQQLKRTGVKSWTLRGEYWLRYPDGYGCSRFCDCFRQWSASLPPFSAGKKRYL